MTSHAFAEIGRTMYAIHPDLVLRTCQEYKPVLKDLSYLSAIYAEMVMRYPDLDLTDQRILFVAIAYKLYWPSSLLGVGKARPDLRKAIADVLGYVNGENVNRWLGITKAYMKNQAFRAKVNKIVEIWT